jgi:hypothetical protein
LRKIGLSKSRGRIKVSKKNKTTKTKIVTKDVAASTVPVSISDYSSPLPSVSVVQTPPNKQGISSPYSIGYWPAAPMWPQQSKEAAKKVYYEYINALNQYMNTPEDQSEHKLELAGKMNDIIVSMVQGLEIGTRSAEEDVIGARTGNQASVLNLDLTRDTIEKLLKTIWVHNTAAYRGKFAGLEVKLIDSQLSGRVNRALSVNANDMGIPLQSADEADTLWMDNPEGIVPSYEEPMVGDEEVLPEDEVSPDGEVPMEGEEEGLDPLVDEELPVDENGEPAAEVDENGEPITDEEVPVDENGEPIEEEFPLDENGEPILEEEVPEEEMLEEGLPDEEVPLDENGAPIEEEGYGEEEGPIEEEEVLPEGADSGLPEEGQEEEIDIDGEPIAEEEFPGEESEGEETPVEEEELPDEDETVYCIVCDREVSLADIEACENPDCPFVQEETEEEAPEEPSDEIETEEEPSEEGPKKTKIVEETKPSGEKKTVIEEEKKEKHFLLLDHEDHCECQVYNFIVKDFSGVEGEYCLTCQKAISYSFDQNEWASEDAKVWVRKQFKQQKIKNKSAEEIVQKSLEQIPEDALKGWLYKGDPEPPQDKEIDLDSLEIKSVLRDVISDAFSGINKRIASLE